MERFLKHLKFIKWFAFIFLSVVAVITVPVLLSERRYLDLVLLSVIVVGILMILFGLNRYFTLLAIEFSADENYAYFCYEDHTTTVAHSQVQQIKCTPYRYIFYLDNGKKVCLSRITGLFSLETAVPAELRELYPGKLV